MTAAGANATTLGANDVIDGGTGTDTLNIEVLSAAADLASGTGAADPGLARNAVLQGTIKNVEKVFITNGASLADATVDVTKLGAELQEAWQVTSAKGVSGVTTQAVGFKNVDAAAVAVAYGATTKTGTIALDNAGKGGLTVSANGAVLETLTVAGTVKAANATTAGTVTLQDDAGAGAGSVKTLNLNLSTAAIVSVAGLDQLTTIASTGAGGLNLGATLTNKVKTVTTGAGDDTLTLATATSATTNASVSTGAGKDTITVSTTSLTAAGTVTIDAGAGDDGVVFTRALNVRDKVDGGDGKDTLTVVGTALIAEDYEVLKAVVSNVETLKFSQAMVGADASKLAQFGGFSFTTTGSSITKVADAQTLAVAIAAGGSLAATAAGYIAKDTGATPAVASTTYAGTLTVEASGGTRIDGDDGDAIVNYGPNDVVTPTVVDAKANAINLTVKATPATAAAAGVESNVSLTGDVTTATVNLVNSVNAATGATATGDALAVFSMAPTTAGLTAGGAFNNLGGLTTLNVTGNGYALIDASGTAALKTVDASGMTGVASYDATKTSGGLKMLANNVVAETITLGGGLDVIVTSSTYGKMDTITGLKLVATAASATVADLTKSDVLDVGGVAVDGATTFAKTTVTGASLGLAFVDAAAKAGANLVFQYDGNTYIYSDSAEGGAGTLQDGDIAVKLTGLVDLDLLVSMLNA